MLQSYEVHGIVLQSTSVVRDEVRVTGQRVVEMATVAVTIATGGDRSGQSVTVGWQLYTVLTCVVYTVEVEIAGMTSTRTTVTMPVGLEPSISGKRKQCQYKINK